MIFQYTNDSKAGWKKLLTTIVYKTYSYTEEYPNGKSTVVSTENINYDTIGNPTNYQGASIEWYGRQMTSYSKGNISATFTYDADGLRGSKTVNGAETTYLYVGDQLMYESRPDGIELYFYYDSYGNLSVIRYLKGDDDYYFYVTTNSQGDVLGIYSASGDLKASYEYDTWGNCTIVSDTSGINIATVNPIRYRGYYYDNDLGLYYLQSRYYDATIGRFINADGTLNGNGDILGFNMFAYCSNNPVMFSDPSGCGFVWAILGLIVVGACVIGFSGCSNSSNKTPPSTSQSTTSPSSNNYTAFRDALCVSESSDNYSAKNSDGYLGRYQMGELALQDAGFKDSSNNWTERANSFGVYSENDFLNNPACQDAAVKGYHQKQCDYIRNYGLDVYIGQTYCGVTVTESGLLAACHLVGAYRMSQALPANEAVWDANGTHASTYMSMYGGYDISEVW